MNKFKNILCIKMIGDDTYDIFLIQDNKIASIRQNESNRKEDREILDTLDEVLAELTLKLEDLNLIAVMHGRGSFTSNRLAAVTGNTLSSVLKIPIIGIQIGKEDSSEPEKFKERIFDFLENNDPELKDYLDPQYTK